MMEVGNMAGISKNVKSDSDGDDEDEAPQPLNVKISPMKNAN
jgi:hypothetical protein